MEKTKFRINGIPAVRYGEQQPQVYFYIHGKGGSKEEAEVLADIAVPVGYQVIGIDLPGHGERLDETDKNVPWFVVPELQAVMRTLQEAYQSVSLYACSIGAYDSLNAFCGEVLANALFVSPVLDMKQLIENMMGWAGVTPEQLRQEKVIETNFGEALSWQYYEYAIAHPIATWNTPTSVLWAGSDHLTDRKTVTAFAERFHASLTIMENGEHWFHTPGQMEVLRAFMKRNLEGMEG